MADQEQLSAKSCLCSSGLLDESGSQATRADRHVALGSIHDHVMTCDVDLLAALADVVGMTDLIAYSRTSSAYLTLRGMCGWHGMTSDDVWLLSDRFRTMGKYTVTVRQNQAQKHITDAYNR